jgi:hypothetical protein
MMTFIPTPSHVLSHKIKRPKEETVEERKHDDNQKEAPAEKESGAAITQTTSSTFNPSGGFRRGVILPPGCKGRSKEVFRETTARDFMEPFHIKMTYVMRTIEDLVNVIQMEEYT